MNYNNASAELDLKRLTVHGLCQRQDMNTGALCLIYASCKTAFQAKFNLILCPIRLGRATYIIFQLTSEEIRMLCRFCFFFFQQPSVLPPVSLIWPVGHPMGSENR